jgi:3-oxoacyl-[acyl-carrier-protein] synthase II
MKKNRVVVTGLGVITPIGLGFEAFWEGLKEGRNGISEITRFDPTDFRSHMAAEVKDFDPENWIDGKSAERMDRFVHFAMASSAMAISEAGLNTYAFNGNRAGVIIGSGIGGANTIQDGYAKLHDKGPRSISPFFVTKSLINMAASMVSITYGLKGPQSAPCMACSTGGNAIGSAFHIIQRGDADIMLAGSTEASISPLPFAGFCAARSMSTRNDCVEKASRPFDKSRDGFVMGEGAGVVVLEKLEHAASRDAKIYAEIVGYGNTGDAFHFTAPEPGGDGMIRVMKEALKDASIDPQNVGYINAHGTSTVLNDKTESLAILDVFGEHSKDLKISSTKSMIGHLMSAAGAVEFVATVMSVYSGKVHPTINYKEPDPECPLDYVVKGVESIDLEIALSNSFGFGGGNVCLAVRRYDK